MIEQKPKKQTHISTMRRQSSSSSPVPTSLRTQPNSLNNTTTNTPVRNVPTPSTTVGSTRSSQPSEKRAREEDRSDSSTPSQSDAYHTINIPQEILSNYVNHAVQDKKIEFEFAQVLYILDWYSKKHQVGFELKVRMNASSSDGEQSQQSQDQVSSIATTGSVLTDYELKTKFGEVTVPGASSIVIPSIVAVLDKVNDNEWQVVDETNRTRTVPTSDLVATDATVVKLWTLIDYLVSACEPINAVNSEVMNETVQQLKSAHSEDELNTLVENRVAETVTNDSAVLNMYKYVTISRLRGFCKHGTGGKYNMKCVSCSENLRGNWKLKDTKEYNSIIHMGYLFDMLSIGLVSRVWSHESGFGIMLNPLKCYEMGYSKQINKFSVLCWSSLIAKVQRKLNLTVVGYSGGINRCATTFPRHVNVKLLASEDKIQTILSTLISNYWIVNREGAILYIVIPSKSFDSLKEMIREEVGIDGYELLDDKCKNHRHWVEPNAPGPVQQVPVAVISPTRPPEKRSRMTPSSRDALSYIFN